MEFVRSIDNSAQFSPRLKSDLREGHNVRKPLTAKLLGHANAITHAVDIDPCNLRYVTEYQFPTARVRYRHAVSVDEYFVRRS